MAKAAKLLPVYLFIGEDKLKRKALLKRMQERVGAGGDLTLNQSNFSAGEVEPPDAIASACNTVPFLAEMRLVVVNDIDHAKKPVIDSICDYIEEPMESTVLILTGDKLAKNNRIYKTATKKYPKCLVDCEPKKKERDVVAFVEKMSATRHISIDPNASRRLIDLVGNSTVAIDTEVNKLADYLAAQGRDRITQEDVDNLVARTNAPKPWEFADALCERNASKALAMLVQMPDQSPYGIMTLCVRRMRELLRVKANSKRPSPQPLGALLGGPDWKYKNYSRFASNFRESELIEILDKSADCECMMKTGSNPELCMQLWVAGICSGTWSIGSGE